MFISLGRTERPTYFFGFVDRQTTGTAWLTFARQLYFFGFVDRQATGHQHRSRHGESLRMESALRFASGSCGGTATVKAYWSAHPDQAVAFDTCPASSADQASTEDCIIRDQVLLPARAAPGLAVVEVLREGASSPDFRTELNVLDVQNHRLLDHPLAAESGSAKPSIHLRIWPHPLRRASQLGGPGDAKEGVAAVAASLQSGPSQSSLTEEDMEDEEFEEEEEEEEELEDASLLELCWGNPGDSIHLESLD
ncbi:hypothetical protein AK812_SmicGene40920 [Symbiodinium microadriaticum]|uniref:Uncharacterized protein n=1 Tax=Symbiodinium microadriaticum TaxID=2951 RepID=A0A1Q9C7D4_SYMMI|nr:hypothetical protein AK812_SmicGene40920 [Symbiodinium microadriaticum]